MINRVGKMLQITMDIIKKVAIRNRNWFLLSSFILALASCQPEQPKFEGVWVGAAVEADKEIYQPLSFLLIAKEDGQYNSYPIQNPDSNWKSWEYKKKILRLDTHKYIFPEVEIGEDDFVINRPYKIFFHRMNKTVEQSTAEVAQLLNNHSWKSNYDEVQFVNEDEVRIRSLQGGAVKSCWSLHQDQGLLFLIKQGNQVSCEKFQRFTEVITEVSSNSFTVERWEESGWKTIEYIKIEAELFDLNDFQLCNPYLIRSNARHRYYYQNTFYKGGIYKINKLINAFYKAPEGSKESGLIKVEFVVNCQGLPGKFSVLEMNEDYEETSFSQAISSQLLAFTKTLKDWNAGRNDKNEAVDTYRFLIYRIENGKVVEIYP